MMPIEGDPFGCLFRCLVLMRRRCAWSGCEHRFYAPPSVHSMELVWRLSSKRKLRCWFISGTATVVVHVATSARVSIALTTLQVTIFSCLSIPRLQLSLQAGNKLCYCGYSIPSSHILLRLLRSCYPRRLHLQPQFPSPALYRYRRSLPQILPPLLDL